MKQNWIPQSAKAIVVAALLVAGAGVNAAEAKPPVPVTPSATNPEETPEAKAAREARERAQKPFKFEMRERRDPFVFIAKTPNFEKPVDKGTTPGGDIPGIQGPSQETIAKVKAETEAIYAEAEQIFLEFSKEGKAAEVIAKCDEALKIFGQYPGASGVEQWQGIREKLFDLRKAAERIRLRQDAKRKFEELNIRLTGIVAKERNSQAIVNSRTVRKGDVVAASDSSDVVVDEIRSDQVVFVFQGFKMALNLSDGPK
jgi:hypothetical protein